MFLALKTIEAAGLEAEVIHLSILRIESCTACMECARGGRCPLDARDDMAATRERLHAARGLVVASPLHFTSLTAPLIATFSRLEPEWLAFAAAGFAKPSPEFRNGAGMLVVTGGGDYRAMFEPARRVAAAVFNTLGLLNLGSVEAGHTSRTPVAANTLALKRASAAGRSLRAALSPARRCL
jgi:multimeric flavodoxin WrbA